VSKKKHMSPVNRVARVNHRPHLDYVRPPRRIIIAKIDTLEVVAVVVSSSLSQALVEFGKSQGAIGKKHLDLKGNTLDLRGQTYFAKDEVT
jgi:hypothetical protein